MQTEDPATTALWARVKADHDTRAFTQVQLSEKHGVTLSALKYRARRDLWAPRYRSKSVDRPMIIARMFRVLELQVLNLETEMNDMAQTAQRSGDKEVSLLGKLASNLDRLMDLDARADGKPGKRRRTKQMQDIRNKLVERIEQLKRS